MELNKWIIDVDHWCPAQIYYYFKDNDGDRWCIYLRWRHNDPWSAELVRCDENWDLRWGCDTVDLLEEKEHIPGIVKGYYYDEEYPFLMERVLELVRNRFPNLVFPNEN